MVLSFQQIPRKVFKSNRSLTKFNEKFNENYNTKRKIAIFLCAESADIIFNEFIVRWRIPQSVL